MKIKTLRFLKITLDFRLLVSDKSEQIVLFLQFHLGAKGLRNDVLLDLTYLPRRSTELGQLGKTFQGIITQDSPRAPTKTLLSSVVGCVIRSLHIPAILNETRILLKIILVMEKERGKERQPISLLSRQVFPRLTEKKK